MSLDTIPTRSNDQTIDATWYNILQDVLSDDVVPRTGGVPTDNAGACGTTAFSFSALCALLAKLKNASGKILTLAPSSSQAADTTFTFPAAAPASTSKLAMDTSGNILASGLSAPVRGSSTSATITANTYTDIASVTITATGAPIRLSLDSATNDDSAGANILAGASGASGFLRWVRDSTTLNSCAFSIGDNGTAPLFSGSLTCIDDSPSAGSHTYKLQGKISGSSSAIETSAMLLTAKEL